MTTETPAEFAARLIDAIQPQIEAAKNADPVLRDRLVKANAHLDQLRAALTDAQLSREVIGATMLYSMVAHGWPPIAAIAVIHQATTTAGGVL